MLQRLKLQGVLSFKELDLELKPLNVLIGPNASGKSNLILAIDLLRSTPWNVLGTLSRGGRGSDWFWKGASDLADSRHERMVVEAFFQSPVAASALRYKLEIEDASGNIRIAEELLEDLGAATNGSDEPRADGPRALFTVRDGRGTINARVNKRTTRPVSLDDVNDTVSVFGKRKDPVQYPEVTALAKQLEEIKLYRGWGVGMHYTLTRLPHPTQGENEFLNETGSNLALVLNRMERDGSIREVEDYMRRFYEHFDRISVQIEAGKAQIYLREEGMRGLIPATYLSEGTVHFLALLSVLCHPDPPPLVAIEEPELHLHPDVIPVMAELLKKASQRTQLVVTTHSEALVDALSEDPESVIVCEKDFDNATTMRRLSSADLETWLERYRLGQLWRKGEIGGTRW